MSKPGTAPGRTEISALITAVITEIVPTIDPGEVSGDKDLRQLGADSIDRVEIIIAVLDRLGLREPLSGLGAARDIDAMVDLLQERVRR